MFKVMKSAKGFLASEDGPTTTEYAVMLALIIVVSIASISGIGSTVGGIFTSIGGSLPTGTLPTG